MSRILIAILTVSIPYSCSGVYGFLTAEEKDHYNAMYESMAELAAQATLHAERARDAADRAERAAARARGPDVEHAEGCLANVLAMARLAESGAVIITEFRLRPGRGLHWLYPKRVEQYTATLRLTESVQRLANDAERAAKCEPETQQQDLPALPDHSILL